MPSRFDKYRVKDGVTPLGERFFNPVFQDIDIRIAGLENLTLSWAEAVRQVSDFGLARINEVLGPAFTSVTDADAEIQAKLAEAIAALAAMEEAVEGFQADADADIEAWRVDALAELEAWQDGLTTALPGIDTRLDTLEGGIAGLEEDIIASMPLQVATDDLGNFAAPAGFDGQLAAVHGFGLYRFDAAATDIADGEVVIAPGTGTGRWFLVAPHWDFVWAYLAGLLDDLQGQMDAVNLANPDALVRLAAAEEDISDINEDLTALQTGKFDAAKVLTGSAVLDFPSIAAGASQTLTITVEGAATTNRVVLNPPSTLPNGVVPVAYVSSANTVTVRLNNVTTAAIDPASMTYLVTVIQP